MFAKYLEIIQLLLLLCIILHNCRSSPIKLLERVMKSPNEETTNQHRLPRSIWPLSCFTPNEDDASNFGEEIDLSENLNLNKYPIWKFHRYNKIELTPMQISLFPTKENDERKGKIITDNVQQKATNQSDINGDIQIVHVTKESNQSSDQTNQSFFKDFSDLTPFLSNPQDYKPNHRVPRIDYSGRIQLQWHFN